MSTNVSKPIKVAIIGASGTYGRGILARAEEIGVEAVVVTRSPHKFKEVKPTTTVVEAQLELPVLNLTSLCPSTYRPRLCWSLRVRLPTAGNLRTWGPRTPSNERLQQARSTWGEPCRGPRSSIPVF